jgi:hypothetical protein
MHVKFKLGNCRQKKHMGDVSINERIILKRILQEKRVESEPS